MNATQPTPPPSPSPLQNQERSVSIRLIESGFDGHLMTAENDLHLYANGSEQFDKGEVHREDVEKKREKERTQERLETVMAAQMLFSRNFESALKTEAGQSRALSERRIIQEKAADRKAYLHSSRIAGDRTVENIADKTGEVSTAKPENTVLIEPDTASSSHSSKGLANAVGEMENKGNPFRYDAGKAPVVSAPFPAISARMQNSTQYHHSQGDASSGKGHAKPAVGKGYSTANGNASVLEGRKFESMLQARSTRGQPSRNEVEIREVVNKVKLMISAKKSEIIMRLTPDHLGKLEVRLKKDGDRMTGLLKVENQSVKELLTARVAELQQALEIQGIQIEDFIILANEDRTGDSSFAYAEGGGGDRESGDPDTQNPLSREEGSDDLPSADARTADQAETGTNIYV